jgi:metal-sulfur cluster biosynthetic enzyme
MKRENAAKENRYKCVAVYNTDTILEKEITIYNLSSSYDITIASSNGTQFYFDVGTTNLSCLINGTLQTDSKYTYS